MSVALKLWSVSAIALSLVACDEPGSGKAGGASPSTTLTGSASAAVSGPPEPSASGMSRCDELNGAIWQTVHEAPKGCFKKEDCVIVGPAKCKVQGKPMSCVAGISKGHEERVDALAKRWEAAGCDKGLAEPENERLVCKAGACLVVRDAVVHDADGRDAK